MMDDKILDELLTQWKTERTPRPDEFTSDSDFEAAFLTKAAAVKRPTPRKKTSILDVLVNTIPTLTANRKISVGRSQRRPAPLFAMPKMAMSALIAPHACMECCAPSGLAFSRSEVDLGGSTPVFDTEEYKTVGERPFVPVSTNPLSTFGADVDTAMYANLRRMILQEDRLPPAEAVRLEELINYFSYDYPMPQKDQVMRPHFEQGDAPWDPAHRLLLIGVQAKTPVREQLPPSHYVFLIDNSGSMEDVFPMVREAMTTLAKQLRPGDKVSMVTYGGGVQVLLEGSSDIEAVCRKIEKLETAGYTPGGEGIQKAYSLAEKHFIEGGNNRIVLVTDGDFNVGASSEAELVEMVKAKRESGIYLSIAGCGMGNYKDNKLKMLANKGNGNVFYLDSIREAKRVFVHGLTGNMYALARDVKFQIEFNPGQVFACRLLGYELRDMTDRDFRDDNKESGTVGLGQQVTALYEIIPANAPDAVKNTAVPEMPQLKYQGTAAKGSKELLTFRLRYRDPEGKKAAHENTVAVKSAPATGPNWKWASAVAEFGLALRNSKFAPDASIDHAAAEAQKNLGDDVNGDRAEFLLLLRRAAELRRKQ
ncbi:MAG: DUF3520 domain-containing protein [Lentisphaerae bacterium]|nr:DUF3520 domain-containing protein [Lentisphaerota bacterium]